MVNECFTVKLVAALKSQGAKVVRIQAWTLLWDDRAQLESMLTYIRDLDKYINLVRSELEKPLTSPPLCGTVK